MAIGMNLFLNEHSHLNAPVYLFKFSILQITFNESDTLFLQLNQNVTTDFHWGISTAYLVHFSKCAAIVNPITNSFHIYL